MSNSTFEQELKEHGRLIYPNVGDSMMPLLRERHDVVVIERKRQGRCRKYDVPLYKRDSGQYVLHRILKVRRDDYVMCGDNRCGKEYGITDRHIIGRMTGFVRDGVYYPVTGMRYRCYVHLWCDFFWLRIVILRGGRLLKKLGRLTGVNEK